MKKMKKLLALVLALAMLLSLAACAGDTGAKTDGGAPSDSTPADTGKTDDKAPEGDKAPAGDEAPSDGAAADTVKIGVLLPMSGPTSYYGEVQYNGIEFCADYVNANGGIKSLGGAKVELVLQDSAGDPETGVSAFEVLLDDGVSAVVGPYNSTVAGATTPLAIQHGVPYVICNSTAENFMGEANKYVYRTNLGSSDGDNMWTAVINYLDKVRPDNPTDKIAIVYDEGDWGAAAVSNWRNNAEEWGYEIVVDEAVSESTTDMSTLVSKIKAADADLVITAVFTSATNLLAKTLYDYQCSAVIAGLGGGVGDTTFIQEAGAAAEGVLYTAPWVPSWGGGSDEVNALAAQFKEKYDYEMTMEPAWGWLAVATVIEAIEQAGSADREAIADALYTIDIPSDSWVMLFSGYDGVKFCTEGQSSEKYGSTSGERYNQNLALGDTSGMILIQVQDGAWTAVYPTDYTDGQDIIRY